MPAPAPSRRLALAVLIAGVAAILAVFARTDWSHALATSPLELIPSGDRSEELAAVRQLAGDAQSRALLIAVSSPSGHAAPAAEALARSLNTDQGAPGMSALNPFDPTARRESGKSLFDERHALLLPAWLARAENDLTARGVAVTPESLADHAVRRLDAFFQTDAAFAFEKLTPRDPLLLVADATLPMLKEAGAAPGPNRALVWVDTARPPLSGEARAPVMAALDRATGAARATAPDTTVETTGVAMFADASERGIKGELGLLNGLSLAGVALMCALVLRRLAILPHVAVLITLSGAAAWAVTLCAFGRIHVFAVALGALLSGIAVDYALYAMLHDGADGRPASLDRIRPILKPLLAGALVASAGFAFLILSPLPAIRQTGLFTAAGILASLLFSVAWGSLFRFRHRADTAPRPALPARARLTRAFGWGTLAILIAGIPSIRWQDSLRDLEYPLPELRARDREIRQGFGENSRRLWLVSGATCGEALARLHAFANTVRAGRAGSYSVRGPLTAFATPAQHARADRFVREHGAEFAVKFREKLACADYRAEDFSGFFAEWEKLGRDGLPAHEPAAMRCLGSLTGPESMLVSLHGERRILVCWTDAAQPMPALSGDGAAFPLNRLESLNATLALYREDLMRLVFTGFACTVALNLMVMRRVSAVKDFALPTAITLASAGAAGWAGLPLSLFHLAGGFLALCCALHYPMFAREAKDLGKRFPLAVTLAWATTAISFGALMFSRIPAVAALGVTVVVIVTATYAALRISRA